MKASGEDVSVEFASVMQEAFIVDPHGAHLTDALLKLPGLARFAEQYGDSLGRIEAIAEIDKELRVLDLNDPAIRQQVQESTNTSELCSAHGAEFK